MQESGGWFFGAIAGAAGPLLSNTGKRVPNLFSNRVKSFKLGTIGDSLLK